MAIQSSNRPSNTGEAATSGSIFSLPTFPFNATSLFLCVTESKHPSLPYCEQRLTSRGTELKQRLSVSSCLARRLRCWAPPPPLLLLLLFVSSLRSFLFPVCNPLLLPTPGFQWGSGRKCVIIVGGSSQNKATVLLQSLCTSLNAPIPTVFCVVRG